MGLARSEGEAGQLGWRGAEEVARLGLALRPTRLAKGAGEGAERGRRWRWAGELAGAGPEGEGPRGRADGGVVLLPIGSGARHGGSSAP